MEKSKSIENWSKQVANLTRQELMELEEKEKTPFQKFLDIVIVVLPLVCGLISVCEYQFLPNNSANRKPYTYLVLLLILIGIYAVRAVYSAIKSKRGDRQPFQKIRHQAPLFAAFFLLLAIYDYLTLKTGILTQPFVPCLNSIINIAWEDRNTILVSTLHTLRLLFLGYFIGISVGLVTGIALSLIHI